MTYKGGPGAGDGRLSGFDRPSGVAAPPSFSVDPPGHFPYFFRLVVDGAILAVVSGRTASTGEASAPPLRGARRPK
jgi:hypothetical protein